MNDFRAAILSGKGLHPADPVLHAKKGRGAQTDDLSSVGVSRSESRTRDHRGDDRHRLAAESATVRYDGATHMVDLVNLSGGGAMIRADFSPRLWEQVDLILAEGAEIECAVRWLRGGRIGLEFAHETRIECDDDARDALLLDTIRKCFPDLLPEATSEAPKAEPAKTDEEARRSERRHPLIWMGEVHYDYASERVRLRNISERGALIESPVNYPDGAELLLDLGEAGQHFATVGWTCGDKAGLVFAKKFNLKKLGQVRPDIAPESWNGPRFLRLSSDEDSPWASGWQRQSLEELRESLEGYLKR